ncbi:MAG TPA: YoaK family protein [Dongiaceae bacterium]|nr:YoaK family protein [Dongiaceae bacterium]
MNASIPPSPPAPSPAAPLPQVPTDQSHLLRILLIVSLSTGVIDAICLLHLKVFTAYMTGTMILVGIHLTGATPLALPPIIALASFGTGATLGGRLVRREAGNVAGHATRIRILAHALTVVTVLVLMAVVLSALTDLSEPRMHYLAVLILGLAMGIQVAGSRQAGVLDMTLPAATMVLHGVFFDSVVAGGKADRQGRRLAVIVALVLGAAVGAELSLWRIWAGLLCGDLLLAGATLAAYALARQPVSETS